MAQREGRRYNIWDLCNLLHTTCDQLPINCNFCWKPLTVLEKVLFDYTNLVLLWKGGRPLGACQFCIKKLATYEFVRFFDRSISCDDVELLFGSVVEAPIRCHFCLRSLSYSEKVQIATERRAVFKVRGGLRALCYWCRVR